MLLFILCRVEIDVILLPFDSSVEEGLSVHEIMRFCMPPVPVVYLYVISDLHDSHITKSCLILLTKTVLKKDQTLEERSFSLCFDKVTDESLSETNCCKFSFDKSFPTEHGALIPLR